MQPDYPNGISLDELSCMYQQQHLKLINGRIFYQEPQGLLHATISPNIYRQMQPIQFDISSKDGIYMRMHFSNVEKKRKPILWGICRGMYGHDTSCPYKVI